MGVFFCSCVSQTALKPGLSNIAEHPEAHKADFYAGSNWSSLDNKSELPQCHQKHEDQFLDPKSGAFSRPLLLSEPAAGPARIAEAALLDTKPGRLSSATETTNFGRDVRRQRTSSYLPQARTRNLDPHHQELLDTDSHKRHCSNTALLCNCAVCYTPTSRMSLQKEQPQYFQQNIFSPEVQLQNTLRHMMHFNRHGTCVILNKI